MKLVLVDSGRGNLRSVEKALGTAGLEPVRTADPDQVRKADRIVVPGQGAFADAMAALSLAGLDQAIVEFVRSGKPYLGICLGLQLLFDESDEHGVNRGLGLLPGRVEKIVAPGKKIPHMGWNDVIALRTDPVLSNDSPASHYYFVHSFAAVPADPSITVLEVDYGARLCAAVCSENITACQFHPEKSQRDGISLLRRWLEAE